MRRPRREQPWYSNRLECAKKPEKMTAEEKAIVASINNEIIANAKEIVDEAIRKGWISYPKPEQHPAPWNPQINPPTSTDSSLW